MKNSKSLSHRTLSIVLCFAILMAYLPALMLPIHAEPVSGDRIADSSTMDSWKDFFLPDGLLSTENAGGVWTDKSVFTNADAFSDSGITMSGANSFLVALSAIGSNMTVTGMTGVPTDTMLVLDVSGSMNDDNNNVAEALAQSANESIVTLLTANPHNRVGVVLYSGPSVNGGSDGSHAVLVLPLGRYTTTDADGRYLNYSISSKNNDTTEKISLNDKVVYEGTSTRPTATQTTVIGGTYIQLGLTLASKQFTAVDNSTTVEDEILGTIKRKPILVLMSDGAPTLASTDFTNVVASNLGDGSSTSSAIGFTTQLTAAYIKQLIETKYASDSLFYTLGLAVSANSQDTEDIIANSVLNPKVSSADLVEFWKRYQALAVDDEMIVQAETWGDVWYQDNRGRWYSNYEMITTEERVTKVKEILEQIYVDQYFAVDESSDQTLSQGLKDAFSAIIGEIQLQSKYFPTLITDNEELSGYVSFVDKIGAYMNVTDVKGILIHNDLFSGADLASNFVAGGGKLGTTDKPTDLGNEMVWAVQARLGIKDADTARTLIELAYQYGQLSYTSDTEFSNYIGWYANAAGEFLGFYHEGVTNLPAATGNVATDPVFTVKSYGYLGEVDEEHGVAKSDMMYATVQVRERISDKEQTVIFAIPAALIPIVTYQVELDNNGDLADLTASGAKNPIRLVYEVALDESINAFNLKEKVSADYLATHTDENGAVSFYTNQYEVDGSIGYNKVNTYSYFNPSRRNDRYYYLNDTAIFSDQNGNLYTGTDKPTGTFYRQHIIYEKNGDELSTRIGYHALTAEALDTAKLVDGVWYIPAGNIRLDFEWYTIDKSENRTSTLPFANKSYVDMEGHKVDDTGFSFFIGATLGNNGKLTVMPESGIRISKALAGNVTSDQVFTFVLQNASHSADNSKYPAYRVFSDGTATEEFVQFANGSASVSLKAGESIYIGALTVGDVIHVTEVETIDFVLYSINGDMDAEFAELTVVSGSFAEADFINMPRESGNLTIAKEVAHQFGENYALPVDQTFTIDVMLSGIGTANATFTAKQTDSELTEITTDDNGKFTVTLAHGQQIELFDLPEGTVATVVERDPGSGFTPQYWDNGKLDDGVVTVLANTTVSVIVLNDYAPEKVFPVNITVNGTKFLDGREWSAEDSFEFRLEKWIPNADTGTWEIMGNATVTGQDTDKIFDFGNAFSKEEYTAAGTYYYRVVEIEPTEGKPGGISYDKTVHSFSVVVTDVDMDGKLEIAEVHTARPDTTHIVEKDGNWAVTVDFVNHYATSGEATVTIDLNKKVDSPTLSTLATLSGFTFELYDQEGNLVETSPVTTDRGFARMVLTFNKDQIGTHIFTLKESIPDPIPTGWTYSTQSYTVIVVVSDAGDGSLKAVISIGDTVLDSATASIEVTFTNTYAPAPTTLPIDFVSKLLSGRPLRADEFTFALTDRDGTVLLTGTNDASGKVAFSDVLKFDKVGIYFYNIVETSANGKGVTVDATTYRITVTVSDQNGALQASYVLVNTEGDQIIFRNTYSALPVAYAIGGQKTLLGRVLLNDEFRFVLTEAVDANGKIADGAKVYTAENEQDGSFTFPAITYTSAGTYYYVVTEDSTHGTAFGIRYDNTAYIVTVIVTDDWSGNLKVDSVSYTVLGGDSADRILFTNEYVANPTAAAIPGTKTLSGKVLTDGQFQFALYAADENWAIIGDAPLETVTNDLNGTIAFSAISYDKTGTYRYLVKEVDGGERIDGITYDNTVYRVTVSVTDDLRGSLHSSVLITDAHNIPQAGIVFHNVYSVSGEHQITLNGEKTLDGRDLVDGEFIFELYESDAEFTIDGQPLMSAANLDGKFSFVLNYGTDDIGKTFRYVVKEQNGGTTSAGVTYSDAIYLITVTVDENGKGKMISTVVISDGENTVETMSFVNTYEEELPPPVTPPITGDDANLTLFMTLILLSVGGITAIALSKKKRDSVT